MIYALCFCVLTGFSGYSAGEIMLDTFLAEDGLTFALFQENFSEYQTDQWGRISTRGWLNRMYLWENDIPAIRGISRLLTRLDLSRDQYSYLDALTYYVEFQLEALRSTDGSGDDRMDFFEAFTDDMYMETSVYFTFGAGQWYRDEMNDLMAWTMGMINDMLTDEQLEEAEYIVEEEMSRWNERDSRPGQQEQWRNYNCRDQNNPGRRSLKN